MAVENSAAVTRTILESASTWTTATCVIRFLSDWSSRRSTVKITPAVSARTPMPMMFSLEPLIGRLTAAGAESRNRTSEGGPGTVDKGDTPFHRQITGIGLAQDPRTRRAGQRSG